MQMVKIQIPDKNECAKGFAALIRRGRVECFRNNTFIVPEPALELLEGLGVSFLELDRGSVHSAHKGLQAPVATESRRPASGQ
jgi:hypothetical protein